MKKLKITLLVISAAVSLFSLRDKVTVVTVPNANPPVAEAYHAPAWMQPQPVSVENLIAPSTIVRPPPQTLNSSPSAEFAESDLLSQESYVVDNEPAKITAANIVPAAPAETPKTAPAAGVPTTVIYGFAGMDSSSGTNDQKIDTGGGGTISPQFVSESATESSVFVISLTPNSGIPGTDIIIQGAGFNSTASNNDVKFGTVSSTSVTYVSANQLRATVPQSGVSQGFANVSVAVNSVTSNKALFSVLKSSAGDVFEDNTQDLLPEGLTLADSSIVRLGDADNDNDLDLFIIDISAGAAYLLINDGQGTFTDATSANLPSIPNLPLITDAIFGDVNKDGYPDVLLTCSSGQSVRLLLNDGHGKFNDLTGANLPSVSGNAVSLDLGDSNGDGVPDTIVANRNVRDVLLVNNGSGLFAVDTNFNLPEVVDGSSDIRFCDLNGDGNLDIITTNNDVIGASSLRNRAYINDGQGQFTDDTANLLPEDSEYSEVLDCGDIDGDGDIDMIIANDSQNVVLINEGNGIFEDQTTDRVPTNDFASKDTKLGDMDGDGYLDIVMLGEEKMSLLLNDGQGSFKEDGSIKLPDYKSMPAILGGKNIQVADIDGDGSLDIIIGGGNLHILVSTSSNKAPVLAPIGNKTVESGKNLTFNVSAEDPNGDELTFLAENLPGGATFLSKMFSWVPAANDIGQSKNIHFIARENTQAALEDSETVTIMITGSGLPMIDYHVPDEFDLDLTLGQIAQFGIHATDPDGSQLTFKWFLNGAEIPSNSGATSSIIFIVPRIGGNTVEVKVSNSVGATSLQWNLTVGTTPNHSPSIVSYSPNQSVVNIDLSAGGGFSFDVKATDHELDTLSYAWKFNNAVLPPSEANLSSGAFIGSVGVAGDYPLEVSVSDGHNAAVTHSWTIHVTQGLQNQPPSIVSYSPNQSVVNIDLSAGGGFSFDVKATDHELDTLSYAWKFNNAVLPPSEANLSSGAFINPLLVAGDYPLEVSVSDGHNAAVTHSWTIHVTQQGPTNRAPTAINDLISTMTNTSTDIDVLSNDSDPDGNALTVSVLDLTQPSHGTTVIVGTKIRYTPADSYAGSDSFTYKVTDGLLDSGSATVNITVNAVNRVAIAVNDLTSTIISTSTDIDVLSNDSDPDGNALTVSVLGLTQPFHGTTVIVGTKIRYTPADSYAGSDSFTYKVTDGLLDSGSATVNITVNSEGVEESLKEIVSHSFSYFWNETDNPETGFIRDRTLVNGDPTLDPHYYMASMAATGFGLAAMCIAAEKYGDGTNPDWPITPERIAARVELILDTLLRIQSNQSPAGDLKWGYKGFFYHFVNVMTAEAWTNVEISSIDTAILVAGALTAGEYFGDTYPDIRTKARLIYANVDWNAFLDRTSDDNHDRFHKQWKNGDFGDGYWDYCDESILLYLLAIGSPELDHAVSPDTYYSFDRKLGSYGPDGKAVIHSWYGSLFAYQYANAFFDLKDKHDARNADWWNNAVNATIANRQFCIDQDGSSGYNNNVWGLSSAYKEGETYEGSYGAPPTGTPNGPVHDGFVNPNVVASAIGMLPLEVGEALTSMKDDPNLWHGNSYGFVGSFKNSSPRLYSQYYVGLDLGASLVMVANYADGGLIWKNFMKAQTRYVDMNGLLTQLGFRPDSDPEINISIDDITAKSQFAYGSVSSDNPVFRLSFNLAEEAPDGSYLLAIHTFMNNYVDNYDATVNVNVNGSDVSDQVFSHVKDKPDAIKYIELDRDLLTTGKNSVTLTWKSGASWVAWSNVEVSSPVINNEWSITASARGSEYRLDDTYYTGGFNKYGVNAYETFEKALNWRSREPYTEILFYVDDLSRDRSLKLKPFGTDGNVFIDIAVNDAMLSEDFTLSGTMEKQVSIPVDCLKYGWNRLRLTINQNGGEWIRWDTVNFALSNPVQLEAPKTLYSGSLGKDTAKLRWESVQYAAKYSIYRSDARGGPYAKMGEVTAPVITYSDMGLSNNTTYYYVVRTVNSEGVESAKDSPEITVTTGPYRLDYGDGHSPNVFGQGTFNNSGDPIGDAAFTKVTRYNGVLGNVRIFNLAQGQKGTVGLNSSIYDATILSFRVLGIMGGEKFRIEMEDGSGTIRSIQLKIPEGSTGVWQEMHLKISDTFDGLNLTNMASLRIISETSGNVVTLYFDEIEFSTVELGANRLDVKIRDRVTDELVTGLSFGVNGSDTKYVTAGQYIDIGYQCTDNWNIIIHTDNMAEDASPKFTGTYEPGKLLASGLIGAQNSGYRVSLVWQVFQTKKYTTVGEQPPWGDFYQTGYVVDKSDWDYNKDQYSLPYRTIFEHGRDLGFPLDPARENYHLKGTLGQRLYVYLGANFEGVPAQTYTTNGLTIDIVID